MVGLCVFAVNPLGPLQEYVAPATVVADKLSVFPVQTGLFAVAVIVGVEVTVTEVVEVELAHPPTAAETE